MNPPADWLPRLGAGEPIARLCAGAGVGRAEFDAWWQAECRRRVPALAGTRALPGLRGPVRIARDPRGVPHGWLRNANREEAIRASLRAAVADLTARFGPDPAGWGKLHTLTQKHVLSGRGDLGSLLDRHPTGVSSLIWWVGKVGTHRMLRIVIRRNRPPRVN